MTVVTKKEYIPVHDTIPGKPRLVYITVPVHDTLPRLDSCKGDTQQLHTVITDYYSLKVYRDTVNLDTLGYVAITDTISRNKLTAHNFVVSFSIPKETVTITVKETAPAKRQLYAGFTLEGNTKKPLTGIRGGFLYKDRRDRVFGIHTGYSNSVVVGISTYWKL